MITTISLFHVYVTPPIEKTCPLGSTFGMVTYSGPFHASATSWRMNDIPIAVISGASRGALRNGR